MVINSTQKRISLRRRSQDKFVQWAEPGLIYLAEEEMYMPYLQVVIWIILTNAVAAASGHAV